MDLQLTGKRAIVTGASRGIGKAIARQLLEEGVEVVIAARGREGLEAAAAALAQETGGRVVPVVADTGDDASVEALVGRARARRGGHPGQQRRDARRRRARRPDRAGDRRGPAGGRQREGGRIPPHRAGGGAPHDRRRMGPDRQHRRPRRPPQPAATSPRCATRACPRSPRTSPTSSGPLGVNVAAIHPGATRTEKTDPAAEARLAAGVTTRRLVDASDIAWLVAVLASPRQRRHQRRDHPGRRRLAGRHRLLERPGAAIA